MILYVSGDVSFMTPAYFMQLTSQAGLSYHDHRLRHSAGGHWQVYSLIPYLCLRNVRVAPKGEPTYWPPCLSSKAEASRHMANSTFLYSWIPVGLQIYLASLICYFHSAHYHTRSVFRFPTAPCTCCPKALLGTCCLSCTTRPTANPFLT